MKKERLIRATIVDMVAGLFYYDRKEDGELTVEDMEALTSEDIELLVSMFKDIVTKKIGVDPDVIVETEDIRQYVFRLEGKQDMRQISRVLAAGFSVSKGMPPFFETSTISANMKAGHVKKLLKQFPELRLKDHYDR